MVTEIDLTTKKASKNFSEGSNGKSTLELVRVPKMSPLGLVSELNHLVDREKLLVNVWEFSASKYACLERTVRRYYSKVRQAYTSVNNQQPEAIDNDGRNKGHESDLSPESSSNYLSDDGESDDKCDLPQKRSTVKTKLNDEQGRILCMRL